jgi:hypothetical protein
MTAGGTTGTSSGESASRHDNSSPFRVLGIALVIDQLGKEAKLAFRYPTSLNSGTPRSDQGNTSSNTSSNDIFFTLSARQMAKLFRPKHALCGQPMTLSVGGTVFCFRAVLMGDPPESTKESNNSNSNSNSSNGLTGESSTSNSQSNDNSNNNSNSNNDNMDHLVLFSVIVALAPQVDISSVPIAGWYEGNTENQADMLNQSLHRFYSSASIGGASSDGMGSHSSQIPISQETRRASASFLAIRRVQLSLARLCRVLEREEKRCRYISIQSNQFFRIRAELQKEWEGKAAALSTATTTTTLSTTTNSKPTATGSSPNVDFSGGATDRITGGAGHRRGNSNSFSQGLMAASVVTDLAKDRRSVDSKNHGSSANITEFLPDDKEQEVLEHVLASGLKEDDGPTDLQHGNLGRELVQVFHVLSRNDHNFPPSPSILSGRDGVVYVNRHIAVALEAVSLPKTLASDRLNNTIVRPYHTLIFPNASPSQLLQALQSSGFTVPLQQLLLMVRPSKHLMDIALDANLSLSVTMELANYMVSHGACVASTVLTRRTRLACMSIDRLQEMALDFSQQFDMWSVSLVLIVSFLTTTGRSLGECMTALTTGEDCVGALLRAGILASIFHEDDVEDYVFVAENDQGGPAGGSGYETPGASEEIEEHQLLHPRAQKLEEVLYSMAIWLLSHQVLAPVHDYLVLPRHTTISTTVPDGPSVHHLNQPPTAAHGATATEKTNTRDQGTTETLLTFDDSLLKELHESDCLNGNASTVAISWRLGLDEAKLRSWAVRLDKLRIVSRVAEAGDDWGAV